MMIPLLGCTWYKSVPLAQTGENLCLEYPKSAKSDWLIADAENCKFALLAGSPQLVRGVVHPHI